MAIDNNKADYYYWRGRCYQARRDKLLARQDFEKAIKLGHKEARLALDRL